ncbi:TIGR02281 family clan AA aspartic protease [Qipengyuania sp. DSG2-2]|uniref:retropepsin-like aspartic protease family protein n=1 Tax=Qipengyuania sp. DGS2-2 TaxID=3349631 RepID=UPI0036D3EA1F
MDLKALFDSAAEQIAAIPQSQLLMLAVGAMLVGWLGAVMIRRQIPLGRLVRTGSTLVLVGVLVTVVLQVARLDPRLDIAMPGMGLPEQTVVGEETRVPLAQDGHFWLTAQVNGVEADFLVDTGATLTAISQATAEAAGLEPNRQRLPVQMTTANGTITVSMTSIDEMRFGNVAASGLDAVIAPNLGETNVIGMNLLSRLAGWRVEDNVLILTPNNPQPELVTGV